MSLKQYLKRGFKFILQGVPVKNITANIVYLQPDGRLSGKKIIVTGGSKGLGAAMAAKFVAEGASVLISGRNEKILNETVGKISCKYLTLDVQDTSVLDKFISDADTMLEGADCLVNNAGISLHEPTFFDVTPESFDAQIATNLRGVFFLCQMFGKYLKDNSIKGNILILHHHQVFDLRFQLTRCQSGAYEG